MPSSPAKPILLSMLATAGVGRTGWNGLGAGDMLDWEAERGGFGLALGSEKLGHGMGGGRFVGVSWSGEEQERTNVEIGSVGGVGSTVLESRPASVLMLGVFSSGGGLESARSTCGTLSGSHGEDRLRMRSGASPRSGGEG